MRLEEASKPIWSEIAVAPLGVVRMERGVGEDEAAAVGLVRALDVDEEVVPARDVEGVVAQGLREARRHFLLVLHGLLHIPAVRVPLVPAPAEVRLGHDERTLERRRGAGRHLQKAHRRVPHVERVGVRSGPNLEQFCREARRNRASRLEFQEVLLHVLDVVSEIGVDDEFGDVLRRVDLLGVEHLSERPVLERSLADVYLEPRRARVGTLGELEFALRFGQVEGGFGARRGRPHEKVIERVLFLHLDPVPAVGVGPVAHLVDRLRRRLELSLLHPHRSLRRVLLHLLRQQLLLLVENLVLRDVPQELELLALAAALHLDLLEVFLDRLEPHLHRGAERLRNVLRHRPHRLIELRHELLAVLEHRFMRRLLPLLRRLFRDEPRERRHDRSEVREQIALALRRLHLAVRALEVSFDALETRVEELELERLHTRLRRLCTRLRRLRLPLHRRVLLLQNVALRLGLDERRRLRRQL
mmetsp:Transcript_4656/g.16096  ORF Transcript_4656/g.16096 Transcript_4656/m.16096 type:complete len:473 (-) Transcript_4656:215-1633(-)